LGVGAVRLTIRVRPGAGRTRVGGEHDGALVVAVSARAVDGRATEAALQALAEALGVRRRAVTLVSGATHRTKVVEVVPSGETGDPDGAALARRVARLRSGG
jgi:uncharacterized protein YggU (UPF0235/DUF167 family)